MSLKIFLLGLMQEDFSFEAGNSFPVGLSDYLFNVKLTRRKALAVSLRLNNQEHLMRDVILTPLIAGKRYCSILIVRNMNSDASGFDITTHIVSISA